MENKIPFVKYKNNLYRLRQFINIIQGIPNSVRFLYLNIRKLSSRVLNQPILNTVNVFLIGAAISWYLIERNIYDIMCIQLNVIMNPFSDIHAFESLPAVLSHSQKVAVYYLPIIPKHFESPVRILRATIPNWGTSQKC